MSLYKRELVKVYPVFEGKKLIRFDSNIKPGDLLLYAKAEASDNVVLPKKVTVLREGPFHFLVSMGKYNVSVNKADVFCGSSILYRLN